jgi:small subunit ribosomal protein S1
MSKESFADLFARGDVPIAARTRRLNVGDKVQGVVGHVSAESVLVDIDQKQQGYFDAGDLLSQDVKVGDAIEGFVVSTDGDQIKLARKFGKEASVDHLRVAMESGVPVEGKVTNINKGGAEVDLGGVRAFCPASQLDDHRVDDLTVFVGRSMNFLVTKVDARDVVLSRRQLLKREAEGAREKTLAELVIGSVRKGRVTQIRDFGAFVDLGGVEGLIPLRELSHERVKAEDAVQIGDVVEVQIKGVERKAASPNRRDSGEKLEVTLSLKSLAPDPWSGIEAIAAPGKVVAGQVTRMADFGAFIRLAAGVEGLLHVSELGKEKSGLGIGQSLLLRVVSVDPVAKRIGLALASDGAQVGGLDQGATRPVVGAIVKATIEKVEPWGLAVQIVGAKGRAGRAGIANAETNTRQGADLRKEFPPGKEVTAKVTESTDRRVRLSIKAAHDDAERADFDTYRSEVAGKSGMGTLADLLKRKMKKA